MPTTLQLHRLGLLAYQDAWDWQHRTANGVREGGPETLALLQHPHVYTFGRRLHRENLLVPPVDAEVVESDRGGDVTYHGPGQLVAYPILNLRRRSLGPADYVRRLEAVMIRTAAAFGVEAQRVAGRPGVWVNDTKLGAVGVRVQRGVTNHGLALNVSPDLSRFDAIVPCGLAGVTVTSLERELGFAPSLEAAEDALIRAFESLFACQLRTRTSAQVATGRVVHSLSPILGEGRAAAGVRSNTPFTTSAKAVRDGR